MKSADEIGEVIIKIYKMVEVKRKVEQNLKIKLMKYSMLMIH